MFVADEDQGTHQVQVPDNISSPGDSASGDLFSTCARRITSLLCGSADVNGGRTMADWERFLRASKPSFWSGDGPSASFQRCIAAAQERFLQGSDATDDTDDLPTAMSSLHRLHKRSKTTYSEQRATDDLLSDPTADVSRASSDGPATEQASDSPSPPLPPRAARGRSRRGLSLSALSVPLNSTETRTLVSAASSESNSRPSSVNVNLFSDGEAVLVDSGDSDVEEGRSTYPTDTDSVGSASIIPSDQKPILNWFRNPWHARTGEVPTVDSGGSNADVIRAASRAAYILFHPYYVSSPFGRRGGTLDDVDSDEDDEDYASERDDVADIQSTSPAGGYPDYDRSSPDGLSSGQSIGQSNQSLSSEEIVNIIGDSDPEIHSTQDGLSPDYNRLRLSSPASSLHDLTEDYEDSPSPTASWVTEDTEDEDVQAIALAAAAVSAEQVLGLLPAGYRRSDDNLFLQRPPTTFAEGDEEPGARESEWLRAHHPLPHPLPEEPEVPAGSSPYLVSTANVISALECPVCFNYMRAPIWLCVNGHNICRRCEQRVSSCPLCRGRLLATRNLALEAIAGDIAIGRVMSNEVDNFSQESNEAQAVSSDNHQIIEEIVQDFIRGDEAPLEVNCPSWRVQNSNPSQVDGDELSRIEVEDEQDIAQHNSSADSCRTADGDMITLHSEV